ncbi:hypothetical protein BOO69_15190 [Sulfitobacter alexandrii]|uniref:Trypsin-like peptidase domain-containing protein n=2 Tax=Sulfitobacter alexandrii TaxID=1917485 RepID=A0A1J0WJT6_9RHOB|nr:hypothetical protein BOO69_15190 [Sulfitobacter alexandrii]
MASRLARALRGAAVCLALAAGGATAQDWPAHLETRQLFRVVVKGLGADGTALQPVKGTAWAVAPGILITADHVTGKALNYKNKSASDKVFIPSRDVTVEVGATRSFQGVPAEKYPQGVVTPSPFESIDAARIGFPDLQATPFALSACDITGGSGYRVLKFNDGNVFQPAEVDIRLKAYGRSNLGDAGSVVVMTGPKGTIVEGDSGSPVLDPQDRVIGLVSAINPDSGSAVRDEVHVTLVKSFLDLVPLQVGSDEYLDIPCSDRVRLRRVDDLRADLDAARADIETLRGEKDALLDRFAALTARNDLLMDQINTLMRNQIRLAAEAERAGTTTLGLPETVGLETLAANELLHETGKKLFDNLADLPPLRPTVTRISSELGSPEWSLSGSISTNNDVAIIFSYDRALSGPPYADELVFCFTPIAWNVPAGTPNDEDPTNRNFYVPLEGPFEPSDTPLDGVFKPRGTMPDSCYPVAHTGQSVAGSGGVTRGSYQWTRTPNTLVDLIRLAKRRYPDSDWNGIYYLQVFERVSVGEQGETRYKVHTRALVDLLRDRDWANEGSAMPCRIFKDGPSLIEAVVDGEEVLPRENECARDT